MKEIQDIPDLRHPENYVILIVAKTTSDNQGVLFDYLHGFGYKVLVAGNGESALAMAEMSRPDIILLDVILPGIDGFETCRRLKANGITKNIPVIFITSLDNIVDKVRAFSLGAIDYITKPIQSEEVLARVKTHLTVQDLQQSMEENNARLQQEVLQREKLIAELDAFAHTVAHDLKNPLGVTINYAQFLSKFSETLSKEDLDQYSSIIIQNGLKMKNIIDELLLLASVRTEEVALEPLNNMDNIVSEAQNRLAYMIEESDAEIIVPESWPVSYGYGPWVEEVWANYLSNAIKYGGEPPRVELGATVLDEDNLVQYWVQDNGDGLSAEAQEKLFVPFNRLNQARAEGHGLGLSIVERIVRKLGGKVSVASQDTPGQGCIFSFYLHQNPNGNSA
jgi:signal transduction histidine kinase